MVEYATRVLLWFFPGESPASPSNERVRCNLRRQMDCSSSPEIHKNDGNDQKIYLARSALLPCASPISVGLLCGWGAGNTLRCFCARRQHVFETFRGCRRGFTGHLLD